MNYGGLLAVCVALALIAGALILEFKGGRR